MSNTLYVQNWNINLALLLMAKNNIETIFFHFHIICTFNIKIMHTYNTYKRQLKNYTNYIYMKFMLLPVNSSKQDSFIKIWQQIFR
jgi:hypothetical protein